MVGTRRSSREEEEEEPGKQTSSRKLRRRSDSQISLASAGSRRSTTSAGGSATRGRRRSASSVSEQESISSKASKRRTRSASSASASSTGRRRSASTEERSSPGPPRRVSPRKNSKGQDEMIEKSSSRKAEADVNPRKDADKASKRRRTSPAVRRPRSSSINSASSAKHRSSTSAEEEENHVAASTRRRSSRNDSRGENDKLVSPSSQLIVQDCDDPHDEAKEALSGKPNAEPPTKRPPTIDVQVHRLRNLNFHPKAIQAMAHTTTSDDSFLAISRENGSIELRVVDKLRTIAHIAGYPDQVASCLAWVTDSEASGDTPTLVGASGNGAIFVVNFVAGCYNSIHSGGGGIYCLTALSGSSLVATGCEDGVIRIFEVIGGKLTQVSSLQSAGSAVLSIAWRGLAKGSSEETVLFAGVADGTIRRYDSMRAPGETLQWKSTLRMTVESHGMNTPTLVWALKSLSDGMIVSGDSLGHVQVWDGKSGTLHQSFNQNTDKADVLSLGISSDELKIFASGLDSRVVCIERLSISNEEEAGHSRWTLTHTYRPHTHDVKAVTICKQKRIVFKHGEKYCKVRDLLVTGGVDTKLCSYTVDLFAKRRPRIIYPWPASSPIRLARNARLILMRRENKVDLYRLRQKELSTTLRPTSVEEEIHVGSLRVKSRSNIVDATISVDADFIAFCDANSLSLFRIEYEDGDLRPTKVALDASVGSCSALTFSQDSHLVAASNDKKLFVFAMPTANGAKPTENDELKETQATLLQTIEIDKEKQGWITAIHTSSDFKWLVTVTNQIRKSGIVTIYRKEEDGDFEHFWDLPTMDVPITAASFLSSTPVCLAVACSNFSSYVFEVETRKLHQWSESTGFPATDSMPPELVNRGDFPIRVVANPGCSSQFLLGSFGAFIPMDTSRKFPKLLRTFPESHVRRRKRRANSSSTDTNENTETATCCLRYNSMLFMDFVNENEIVVVEQPWLAVVATFPEALDRKMYGA